MRKHNKENESQSESEEKQIFKKISELHILIMYIESVLKLFVYF